MILKQIPEDFIVNEIFDLNDFKERDEHRKDYFYFILKKTNYAQVRALEKVANIFNTSRKLINFAGTKDKVGITTGLISIYNLNEENISINLDFMNNEVDDLELKYLGKFKGRVSLGDNKGNNFKITIRDLSDNDIKKAQEKSKEILRMGILNLFDSQRFGYANNSHIVGKYLIQNNFQKALKEVLTSCPKENATDDLKLYTTFINDNWDEIVAQNQEILLKIKEIIPKFLSSDLDSINHLYKFKNDFPGSFRKINKKIRTLYINAYQSYIFNEIILNVENIPESLELYNSTTKYESIEIEEFVNDILEKDNLKQEDFKLKSLPELLLNTASRMTRQFPKNFKILENSMDELNENKKKLIVEFDLAPGEYATNVVKQLFI